MQQEYPTLDGYAPSWADIQTTHTIGGGGLVEMADYKAINTSVQVEVGEQIGASGGRVMRRTTGSKKDEASATYYRSGFRKLVRALMAVAPTRGNQVRIGLVSFDVLIQHSPPGEPEIFVCKLKGCRLLGRDYNMAEGNDADVVEVKLNPIEIVDIIDDKEVILL